MKKKISKLVALISVMIFLVTGLTGCGESECEVCHVTAKCSKVQFFEGGKKIKVCDDCNEVLHNLGSMMDSSIIE